MGTTRRKTIVYPHMSYFCQKALEPHQWKKKGGSTALERRKQYLYGNNSASAERKLRMREDPPFIKPGIYFYCLL